MNDEQSGTVQPDNAEGRQDDSQGGGSLCAGQVGASLVRLLRQQEAGSKHIDTWKGHALHMQGLHSGDTGSLFGRPVSESTDTVSEFDAIAFPIVKRVFASTLGDGGPRTTPEPTGYKLLLEIYEPGPGLVTVNPMSAPTGLLYYMDFQYAQNKNTENNELD